MPDTIGGKTYLRTEKAAREIGISRPTLLLWFRERRVADVARDAKGWRIFTDDDIARLKDWAETRREQPNASR